MKILKKVLSIPLLLILIIVFFPKQQYLDENVWRNANNNDLPLVMAHAGGKGLFPGNTLSAFDYSYNLGVDVLEMDVQMTIDKVLVLRHGENNTGNIRSMSNCDTVIWDETYQYLYDSCNFGYNYTNEAGETPYKDMAQAEWVTAKVHLTTLEELFVLYGNTILYNIEIKADADAWRFETADELYKLLDEYDLFENVLVATSFDDISKYILETYPEMILSSSHDEAQSFILKAYSFTSFVYNPKRYSTIQIPTSSGLPVINELNLATKLLINTAHKHNMAVHYWTINDEEDMRFLIELGCDGIITDYPQLLLDVLEDYK